MARNKYPEETVRKILEISQRLFLQKGYDQTSMQDIIDELGMSKGAIYHHFKSKACILEQISDAFYGDMKWFDDIVTDPSLNGREKVRGLFLYSLSDPRKLELDSISLPLLQNPQMIALQLQSSIDEIAPMLEKLVAEGNRDGSLHVEHPLELAETLLLLANLWLSMTPGDRERFSRRVRFLRQMTDSLGLPIIDDEFEAAALHYFDAVMQSRDPLHYTGGLPSQ